MEEERAMVGNFLKRCDQVYEGFRAYCQKRLLISSNIIIENLHKPIHFTTLELPKIIKYGKKITIKFIHPMEEV